MKAPQIIHRGVGKTCLTFHGICGRLAYPHGDVVIRLRRAGRREYEIEYPATIDGENVCITWGGADVQPARALYWRRVRKRQTRGHGAIPGEPWAVAGGHCRSKRMPARAAAVPAVPVMRFSHFGGKAKRCRTCAFSVSQ